MDSALGKPGILRENPATSDLSASTEVQGRCPACGGTETRVLFAATDRLYATTGRVECRPRAAGARRSSDRTSAECRVLAIPTLRRTLERQNVPRHLLGFRLADLEALIEKWGFEVLRRKHLSLRDNPAGMACSLAPWLDPMARRWRRVGETPAVRLSKDGIFLALAVARLPFTLLEAACRAGSTVMVEARKKSEGR